MLESSHYTKMNQTVDIILVLNAISFDIIGESVYLVLVVAYIYSNSYSYDGKISAENHKKLRNLILYRLSWISAVNETEIEASTISWQSLVNKTKKESILWICANIFRQSAAIIKNSTISSKCYQLEWYTLFQWICDLNKTFSKNSVFLVCLSSKSLWILYVWENCL